MPVITSPHEFNVDDVFVDLDGVIGRRLLLKCEGFNFAGSVKLKAAHAMVEAAEAEGVLGPGSILVESSSGNLGVALAMIAANRGYAFRCITDERCTVASRQLMAALGAVVEVIDVPDPRTGLLGARLDRIASLCDADPRHVWLNQYANHANWTAHYRTTGPSIARDVPDVRVLFVGAGTTGTLMGCARYFRERRPDVRVVAVDTVGSVSFGAAPAPRRIPGLGMSVPPPQLDPSLLDDVVHVDEADTVRCCHEMAARGFLFGGSTGTVVSGARRWLERHDEDATAVAIAPDLGERYSSTIYTRRWVAENYGPGTLAGSPTPAVATAATPT